ncbi:hypothetical protein CcI49_32760 [Frankia sp. CcI49]|uniref:alpha/beta hydrolase n=1 Tax=Frankia sp. CcI49 TaxID=1745382 RepID=UPI0009757DA3|nr:alpha/beta hydrolase fold domain-containing protein [Frankia sp. CcI49]ONH53449.1 hypothetical protein CcI49_32760 [Frankia sp. CcI49]
MNARRILSAMTGLALAGGLAACGSSTDSQPDSARTAGMADSRAAAPTPRPAPLEISFTGPSFDTGTASDVRFATDVSCGADRLNAFDIALPASARTSATASASTSAPAPAPASAGAASAVPLVIYLHGGGFINGDKSAFWTNGFDDPAATGSTPARLLSAGTAVASMNYRLLGAEDDEGVIKPMTDVARCLQYIRYHADSFGIDPNRIALLGNSAGAGTALWLGFHDDLADPDSTDPVARMSTRPQAVAVNQTQATYDIVRWGDDVFADYADQLKPGLMKLIEAVPEGRRMLAFYGIKQFGDVTRPDIVTYRHNVDMLGLMDASDVPFWAANTRTPEALPLGADVMFHHPWHARALSERAEQVGLDATATWGEGRTPPISAVDYILRALNR